MSDTSKIEEAVWALQKSLEKNDEVETDFLASFFKEENQQELISGIIDRLVECAEIQSDVPAALSRFGVECFLAGVFIGIPSRGNYSN